MSNRRKLQTFERDNLVVDIIFQHKGKENAIPMKELAFILTEKGYKTSVDIVHSIVKRVMFDRHLPICSLTCCGYYWGGSRQDIEDAIDELQSKIDGLQERIDLLKSFIY